MTHFGKWQYCTYHRELETFPACRNATEYIVKMAQNNWSPVQSRPVFDLSDAPRSYVTFKVPEAPVIVGNIGPTFGVMEIQVEDVEFFKRYVGNAVRDISISFCLGPREWDKPTKKRRRTLKRRRPEATKNWDKYRVQDIMAREKVKREEEYTKIPTVMFPRDSYNMTGKVDWNKVNHDRDQLRKVMEQGLMDDLNARVDRCMEQITELQKSANNRLHGRRWLRQFFLAQIYMPALNDRTYGPVRPTETTINNMKEMLKMIDELDSREWPEFK